MEEDSVDDVLEGIMETITPLDRWLWGAVIKRTLKNPHPNKYRDEIPRYGPIGSMHLIIATAWRIPGGLFAIVAVILLTVGRVKHSDILDLVSVPFYCVLGLSLAMGIARTRSASELGKLFRARQGNS